MIDEQKLAIKIIELYPHEVYCHLCGAFCYVVETYGLPIYEDEIVPDDYEGEWGGVPACKRKEEPSAERSAA